MRRQRPDTFDDRTGIVQLAWLVSLLAILALIAALATAGSAGALTSVPPVHAPIAAAAAPHDEEDEAEAEAEVEDEEEEAGAEEAGYEECEEDEAGNEVCDSEEEPAEAPGECLLSSARATVFATPDRDKVRLQVRYTATSPVAVDVDYGLHGTKGSLYLGGARKRFGTKGVLRLSRRLSETQMEKVVAAKDFTVRLQALAAPGYCTPFFDHHLNVRRATPSGLAWLPPAA